MTMPDYKNLFELWCVENGIGYSHDTKMTTSAGNIIYKCTLKVHDYYFGFESSTNESEALDKAIKSYVKHLIKIGCIDPEQPHPIIKSYAEMNLVSPPYYVGPNEGPSTVFKWKRDTSPKHEEALKHVNHFGDPPKTMHFTGMLKRNEISSVVQHEEKMEERDAYGWTIEKAKGRLNEFLLSNKMDTDYHYTVLKTEPHLEFMAEKTIVIPTFKKIYVIRGQGVGNSKSMASKTCALSIITQLTRLGLVKPYTEEKKPKIGALVQQLVESFKELDTPEDKPYRSESTGESSRSVLNKDQQITLVENILQLTSLPTHQLSHALNLMTDIVELGKKNLLNNSIKLGEVYKSEK